MSTTVTVYCAGTEYDSRSGDIVAWLNANTSGLRGKELFFFPGPGSGEYADSLTTRKAADVSRTLEKGVPRTLPSLRLVADSAAVAFDAANWVEKKYDAATGDSLHERIQLALALLRAARVAGCTINLVGWSRGAVTCLGIAYALANDAALCACRVNLFLFDPVPGPEKLGLNGKNWSTELRSLKSNINDLSVVLMENDDRDWMMPPLTQPFTECSNDACGDVPRSRISLYPMPGVHSSGVESGGHYEESSSIGAHLVSAFLRDHGSRVPDTKVQSDISLIEMYARLKRKAMYGYIGQERTLKLRPVSLSITPFAPVVSLAVVSAPPARLAKIPNALRHDRFYVNEHHRGLFKKVFARIAWVLDPSLGGSGWNNGAAVDANLLKAAAPSMAQLIGDGVAAMLEQAACLRDDADLRRLLDALGYQGPVAATLAPSSTASFSSPAFSSRTAGQRRR